MIEGFYGQPWSQAERFQLFDWLLSSGLKDYLYAPKDDLKHRTLWREPYNESEIGALTQLIQRAQARGIRFIYAIAPGLDVTYSDSNELELLKQRIGQMLQAGCRHFAILLDDIPDRMSDADRKQFASFALAQSRLTNQLFSWTRGQTSGGIFLFCPTPYCGRMAKAGLGGANYLAEIGDHLDPGVQIFWTGPEIVSREITVEHIREVEHLTKRKPLIWDNLHANDYDGRRFYCGPYSGRPVELKKHVSGFLCNPNCEFPLNYAPLRSFSDYIHAASGWNARESYLAAMQAWSEKFTTVKGVISTEDLKLLGDCYYLPHEEGEGANHLHRLASEAIQPGAPPAAVESFTRMAARLKACCAQLPELCDRALFYALCRRVWDLREELDLLEKFVLWQTENPGKPFHSDYHLPGTYRGGFVQKLQGLLKQLPNGGFSAEYDRQ